MHKTFKTISTTLLTIISLNSYAFNLNIPNILQDKIAVSIVNAQNNQTIYNYRESTPLLLASNMKILTSYAALNQLGAKFNWVTKLAYQGSIQDGILNGNVYLIGGGDPQLNSQDIQDMLIKLRKLGVNKINGDFIYDMSIFNQETKSSELHPEPLAEYSVDPAGLIIDNNLSSATIRIKQQKIKFTQRRSLDHTIKNKLKLDLNSKAGCEYPSDYISANPAAQHTVVLSGTIPTSCNNKTFKMNLLSASDYDNLVIKQLLSEQKIKLLGQIKTEKTKVKTTIIAVHHSNSLNDIIPIMNKDSNNLYAKTLFMSLGAYRTKNQATYTDASNLYIASFQNNYNFQELTDGIENGAGLSRTEKITTGHMTQLLNNIYHSQMSNYFITTLPTPGESGTLQGEFLPFKQKLFAKTGSLSDVQAYSGYFKAATGQTYVVSFIANDLTNGESATTQRALFKQLVATALNQLDKGQL